MPKRQRTEDERKPEPAARNQDRSRNALDFCWDDVSSLRMLGSKPLSDLAAQAPKPAASDAAPARERASSRRWNLVVLGLLVLTLAATVWATVGGH